MSELQQLQHNLQARLLTNDAAIKDYITGDTPAMVKTRLGIYEHAYRYRLLEVLELDYAMIMQLVGDEVFADLGFAYIDAYPSRYYSVNLFDQHFPKFLATQPPAAQQPYLSDLAQFLWALNVAVDAADAPLLTTADIAAVPQEQWGEMVISLQPSVCLHTTQWNILPIWQALIQKQTAPEPQQYSANAYCVVWRKDMQPYYCPMNEQEAWVITALQNGKNFGEICEGLLQWVTEEEVANYTVNLLLRWLQDGMFSTVRVGG